MYWLLLNASTLTWVAAKSIANMVNKHKHDSLIKKALENPIVAKEFFTTQLPKNIKKLIDLSTLKLDKESFIEKNLQKSFSDVLFSVNTRTHFKSGE